MKKSIILLCLLLSLLVAACAPNAQTQGGTTAPSTSVPSTTTQDPAVTTTPPTSAPDETSVPPTEEASPELAAYNALFGDLSSWYNRALTCQYESPRELDLLAFFYCGFPDEVTETAEEWAALKDLQGFNENYDFFRLPVSKMNEVLTAYFGITLEDVEPDGFDGLTYLESTDCYYFMTTGALMAEEFSAVSVETGDDGIITLRYTLRDQAFVARLRSAGDGYIILANTAA